MDLTSGYPFWPIRDGLLDTYPALKQDLRCEVAVIGGGISGAMAACCLAEAGVDVAVIERRDIGHGSTSASTALLIYEFDTHLTELAGLIGEEQAAAAYRVCCEAIGTLEALVAGLDDDCEWQPAKSLYFASRRRDAKALRAEYELRRRHGFAVELWGRDEIAERLPFASPAALYTQRAAQVDPFRLTHALLRRAAARGARIYDRTEISGHEQAGDGLILTAAGGARISARRAVFATGYESQDYLKQRVATLKSTYALISEPVPAEQLWHERCVMWETARPYIYLRTTADNRVLVGGEDIDTKHPGRRDRQMERKIRRLGERFRSMFPAIELDVAYAWSGLFAETKDGMAYIGETAEFPNSYFALGFGGNGITFSMVAAEIIRDLYLGRPNPAAAIFRFDR